MDDQRDQRQRAESSVTAVLGAILSSVGGLGALCTGVGFLAHRGYLKMLGTASLPDDLNQYLATGAQFLALLPSLMITAIFLELEDALRGPLGRLILLGLAILLALIVFRKRAPRGARWLMLLSAPIGGKPQRPRPPKKSSDVREQAMSMPMATMWLIGLLGVQLLAVDQLLRIEDVEGVLFMKSQNVESLVLPWWFPFVATKELLVDCVLNGSESRPFLLKFFSYRLMSFVALGVILFFILSKRPAQMREWNWPRGLFVLNAIFLATQLLLLPANYGALLLPITFPKIQFVASEQLPAAQNNDHVHFLLQEEPNGFYIYNPDDKSAGFVARNAVHAYSFSEKIAVFPAWRPPTRYQRGASDD